MAWRTIENPYIRVNYFLDVVHQNNAYTAIPGGWARMTALCGSAPQPGADLHFEHAIFNLWRTGQQVVSLWHIVDINLHGAEIGNHNASMRAHLHAAHLIMTPIRLPPRIYPQMEDGNQEKTRIMSRI